MNKKLLIVILVVFLIVVAFFAGVQYGKSQNRRLRQTNLERFQQMNGGNNLNRQGGGTDFINGEIVNKDDQIITVKLRDGGSKNVFYSATTEISKFVNGEIKDLSIGQNIMISGTVNSDGNIIAKSIQIKPATVFQPESPTQK